MFLEDLRRLRGDTGGQNVLVPLQKLTGNLDNLKRGFPFAEYHFRHPVPQRAMVVHFCKAEILERQMEHLFESRVNVDNPGAHLFEQVPQLLLVPANVF